VIVRRLTVVATGVALAALLAACGGSSSGTGVAGGGASSAEQGATAAGDAASREADIVFAQSMVPHHQQAVEMADLALKNASSDRVKELASRINGAQDPEIESMRGWLEIWGADEGMAGMDHSGMDMGGSLPGMMSEADMTRLAAAAGADFDRMWLQMMIAHHQGALTMADGVLTTTADPQVKALAQAVVSGQTEEIDTMKGLLAG
jgi:uncharacterized protein (DUF305 family)